MKFLLVITLAVFGAGVVSDGLVEGGLVDDSLADDSLADDSLADDGLVHDGLTLGEFQRLHAKLQPGAATWRSIPWRTSLLDARNVAAEEKKPLFIWAMDGHPLGCT